MKLLKKAILITLIFAFSLFYVSCSCPAEDVFASGDEDVMTRSFNVKSGGELSMDVHGASIEVTASGGDEVNIRVIRKVRSSSKSRTKEILDRYKIDMHQSGDDVIIKVDSDRRNFWNWMRGSRLSVRFIVTVPSKYHMDLKTSGGSIQLGDIEGRVKVKTSGGSLKMANIDGPVTGNTSGGSIKLQNCTDDVNVHTSGGSIRLGHIEGEVTAVTSGGSITVEEVMGTVNATTSGGSISAYISKQPKGDCTLKTSGGSVTAKLDGNIKVSVDARTSGGNVTTDFPVERTDKKRRKHLKADINGGGPQLYLRTSGGSVRIYKND